jgi:hypothetical protein
MPERTHAAGMAEQKERRNRNTDRMMGVASLGAVGLGAAGAVASLAGAPFTAGTSTLGLAPSLAMMGGGIAGLSNDRNRMGIFGGKEYDQLLAGQKSKDFRSQYETMKDEDPRKKEVMDRFEKNSMRDVGMQRSLGIDDRQMFAQGGFYSGGANAGFQQDQMRDMASGILGAGGSAGMARQSKFGLQMERKGLTNAGSVLGTLSGGISTESSKSATLSLISEAFKIGLDNTEFAETNRRFVQAASNVIAKSGASGEDDQNRIAQMMGQFLGDRTNLGVQAAQGSYEKAQERGSQLGGRRGTKRFVAAMQDPALSKIPTDELTELLGMRPDQLKENNEVVAYFADKAGVTPAQLIDKLAGKQGINQKTRFNLPGSEKKVKGFSEVINKYMDQNNLTYSQMGRLQEKNQLPQNVSVAMGGLETTISKEEKEGLTTREARSAAGEFVHGMPMTAPGTKEDLNAPTGRIGDQFNALGAEGADDAREAFEKLIPALRQLGEASRDLTDQVTGNAKDIHSNAIDRRVTSPKGDPIDLGGVSGIMTGSKAASQPQANKVQK